MGYTENMSATYLSLGNPCLDFFFHVVPDTPPQSLTDYLHPAWDHDPLTALKLICNLRGVRGTGKSDKESYYTGALELPEVYIGRKDWGSIPYNRVASIAMKTYKDRFLKYDEERFKEYLEKVKQEKSKIAAGALLPHQIIGALNDSDDGGQVAELQWKRIVDDMSKKGKLKNCLAICDVSGSMAGTPMELSVALGVLVSELSVEPWKGKLITFSNNRKLQIIEGEDLISKVEFVRHMEWGMNTVSERCLI